MFQLTKDEAEEWWLAVNANRLRSQSVILKRGQHLKYRPSSKTELLTRRFMTRHAIVCTGDLAFERGARRDGLVVAKIAVHVIRDLVGEFCGRWFIGILDRRQRRAIVSGLKMAGAAALHTLRIRGNQNLRGQHNVSFRSS